MEFKQRQAAVTTVHLNPSLARCRVHRNDQHDSELEVREPSYLLAIRTSHKC